VTRLPRHGLRLLRGFTLIEVLVALVIVAVGMSALMGALSSSAKTVVYMQDKTFSEWVALNQIATVRLMLVQGQVPSAGNTNGDIDMAGRTWHWRQEVVASQVSGMMLINVKVRPKDLKLGDNDDTGWYVTMTGLTGNALAAAGTATIQWDPNLGLTGAPGTGNTGTTLGGGTTGTSLGSSSGSSGGTTTTTTPTTPKTPTTNR
jgi:general secretion pathway protein I